MWPYFHSHHYYALGSRLLNAPLSFSSIHFISCIELSQSVWKNHLLWENKIKWIPEMMIHHPLLWNRVQGKETRVYIYVYSVYGGQVREKRWKSGCGGQKLFCLKWGTIWNVIVLLIEGLGRRHGNYCKAKRVKLNGTWSSTHHCKGREMGWTASYCF